jgi:hypothetical protein
MGSTCKFFQGESSNFESYLLKLGKYCLEHGSQLMKQILSWVCSLLCLHRSWRRSSLSIDGSGISLSAMVLLWSGTVSSCMALLFTLFPQRVCARAGTVSSCMAQLFTLFPHRVCARALAGLLLARWRMVTLGSTKTTFIGDHTMLQACTWAGIEGTQISLHGHWQEFCPPPCVLPAIALKHWTSCSSSCSQAPCSHYNWTMLQVWWPPREACSPETTSWWCYLQAQVGGGGFAMPHWHILTVIDTTYSSTPIDIHIGQLHSSMSLHILQHLLTLHNNFHSHLDMTKHFNNALLLFEQFLFFEFWHSRNSFIFMLRSWLWLFSACKYLW